MKLVIAEKKELGQNIAHAMCGAPKGCRLPYEGNGYCVVSCIGHMLALMEPEEIDPERWGDRRDLAVLPILPRPWPKEVVKGKEHAVKVIAAKLRACDCVIHAGDPDDEGQLLIDELLKYLGYRGKVDRVYINDNLDKNIQKAFGRLQDNSDCARDGLAAEARRLADFCFGINESRLIAARAGGDTHLAVGRVMTPTLGLVVRRDEEILSHKRAAYFTGCADVSINGRPYRFRYVPPKSLLDPDLKKCTNRAALEQSLNRFMGTHGIVDTLVTQESVKAPLPYNLVDLMSDMGERFKMGAKQVQDATQVLRDRFKAITYNRSDCNYLPVEAHHEAPAVLGMAMRNIGVNWRLDFTIMGRCFSDKDVTAHTGIIPQESAVDLSKMSKIERLVYIAIVERYALQFMPDGQDELSVANISGEDGSVLGHRARHMVELGWRTIQKDGERRKGEEEGFISEGRHSFRVLDISIERRETKPKAPYTETSLAKDMSSISKYVQDPRIKKVLLEKDKGKKGEHGGIGTPATRSAIIEKLKSIGYLQIVKGKLVSTKLGRAVYHACPADIRGADLTATWWLMCERVRDGKSDLYSVAESVCLAFEHHRDTAYRDISITRQSMAAQIGRCPLCGTPVIDRGDGSKVYSCSSNIGHWENLPGGGRCWSVDGGCGFMFRKVIAGKRLSETQARKLLEKGRTDIIKGFKGKNGTFDARLLLDRSTGKVTFDFKKGPAGNRRR